MVQLGRTPPGAEPKRDETLKRQRGRGCVCRDRSGQARRVDMTCVNYLQTL